MQRMHARATNCTARVFRLLFSDKQSSKGPDICVYNATFRAQCIFSVTSPCFLCVSVLFLVSPFLFVLDRCLSVFLAFLYSYPVFVLFGLSFLMPSPCSPGLSHLVFLSWVSLPSFPLGCTQVRLFQCFHGHGCTFLLLQFQAICFMAHQQVCGMALDQSHPVLVGQSMHFPFQGRGPLSTCTCWCTSPTFHVLAIAVQVVQSSKQTYSTRLATKGTKPHHMCQDKKPQHTQPAHPKPSGCVCTKRVCLSLIVRRSHPVYLLGRGVGPRTASDDLSNRSMDRPSRIPRTRSPSRRK